MLKAETANAFQAYDVVYRKPFDILVATKRLPFNPFVEDLSNKRLHSVVVGDIQFGDTGKGQTVMLYIEKFQELFPDKDVYIYRWNGSANAGHAVTRDGIKITTHQLPIGISKERTVNIMGKGMLVHTLDLTNEMEYVKSKCMKALPGKLMIDGNALVATDVHRAYEAFLQKELGAGDGSTSSGVAQGYAEHYMKYACTMRIFLEGIHRGKREMGWEDAFRLQYQYYNNLMGGGDALAKAKVKVLTKDGKREERTVGSQEEFIDRLRDAAEKLIPYIRDDVALVVDDIWRNTDNPFIAEGAQGDGLDPMNGPYDDITASRTVPRVGIPDSTEGLIFAEDFTILGATMKIPYMSIVGSKIPPYPQLLEHEVYRQEQGERGETTGRSRDIYPEDFELMRRLVTAGQYDVIFQTHADAAHQDYPIQAVLGYVDKKTGYPEIYRPYQWHWNKVLPVQVPLPSWDGTKVASAEEPKDLPRETLLFKAFTEKALGVPVASMGNGFEKDNVIYWFSET